MIYNNLCNTCEHILVCKKVDILENIDIGADLDIQIIGCGDFLELIEDYNDKY